MKECLEGLKVVELGQVLAGPFVGGLMADFGANVIKIEAPNSGDKLRTMGKKEDMWFLVEGRNKKTITLNLKSEKGKEILRKILSDTDILVENFRPGVLEKLGFTWESLQKINPKIILCSVSGYGQTGPFKSKPGFNRIGMAMGGLTNVTGFPDGPPMTPGLAVGDYIAGLFAGLATMYAVYNRDVVGTNKGQIIDCSLYEPILRVMENGILEYKHDNIVKKRMGNRHMATIPSGNYLTKDDEYLVLAVGGDKIFKKFFTIIGQKKLINDDRFKTGIDRSVNREEIEKLTEDWVRKHTIDECIELFGDEVPCCKCYSVEDFFEDEQIIHRNNIISVDSKNYGKVYMQGIVPKLSETPGSVKWAGPELGDWNERFYINELGLKKEELDDMKEKGII